MVLPMPVPMVLPMNFFLTLFQNSPILLPMAVAVANEFDKLFICPSRKHLTPVTKMYRREAFFLGSSCELVV